MGKIFWLPDLPQSDLLCSKMPATVTCFQVEPQPLTYFLFGGRTGEHLSHVTGVSIRFFDLTCIYAVEFTYVWYPGKPISLFSSEIIHRY